MLIECKHCGAPLDVAGDDQRTKCTYCGTVSRVKALKTVATQTPPGWRPPAQWTPPTDFAADSAKTLAYHATWAVKRVIRTLVTLAVLAVLLPAVAFAVMTYAKQQSSNPDVREALSVARSAIAQAKGQIEAAKQLAGAAGEPLLEAPGLAKLEARYREALGRQKIRARRLVIHPTHSSLLAADPKRPGHLDGYRYLAGAVSGPEPERVSGREKRELERYLFDLDDVPLDELPGLARRTVTELGYEQGTVSHVIVEKNLPFSKELVLRVYVTGPRDSGRIDWLPSGEVHKVYR